MVRTFLSMFFLLVALLRTDPTRAEFSGHVSIVNSVAFSMDGKQALSGSWDWTIYLWDLLTQKPIRKYKDHILSVNHAVFSPD